MKTLTKDLQEIVDNYSLIFQFNPYKVIETTSERNGYPSNLKKAIIGFNTFEQAKKMADEYGLSIQFFKKKDGWDLWHRTGNIAYNAIQNKAENYGDNYKEYDPEIYSSLEYLYEVELKELIKSNDYSLQELKDLIKSIEYLYEYIEYCNDDLIVISDGNNVEIVDRYTMYWSNDTNHIAIGLIEE